MTMDDTDRALLALLRENARAPTALTGAPAGAVAHHGAEPLERLERSGVIAGYTVRLSDEPSAGWCAPMC